MWEVHFMATNRTTLWWQIAGEGLDGGKANRAWLCSWLFSTRKTRKNVWMKTWAQGSGPACGTDHLLSASAPPQSVFLGGFQRPAWAYSCLALAEPPKVTHHSPAVFCQLQTWRQSILEGRTLSRITDHFKP